MLLRQHYSHTLAALFIALAMFSCGSDEEPDTAGPAIEFLESATEKFRGVATFTFRAADESNVNRIQVFTGSDLIADQHFENQPSASVQVTLNTLTKNDGTYLYHIVATDGEGNVAEWEYHIQIDNFILHAYVPENYLSNKGLATSWLVLATKAGDVVGYQKLVEGELLKFPRPENYNDEDLQVHILDKYSAGYFIITGYTSIGLGDLSLFTEASSGLASVKGIAKIKLNDVPEGAFVHTASPDASNTNVEVDEHGTWTMTMQLRADVVDVAIMVTEADGAGKIKILEQVKLDDDLSIQYTGFTAMDLEQVAYHVEEEVTSMLFYQNGYRNDDFARGGSNFYVEQLNELNGGTYNVYHEDGPGIFDGYQNTTQVYTETKDYYYRVNGSDPAAVFKTTDITLEAHNFSDGISISLSDKPTVINLNATYTIGEQSFDWFIFLKPNEEIEFKLPEVPQEVLTDFGLSGEVSISVDVLDVGEGSGEGHMRYDAWLSRNLRNTPFDLSKPHETMFTTYYFESPGGRKRTHLARTRAKGFTRE